MDNEQLALLQSLGILGNDNISPSTSRTPSTSSVTGASGSASGSTLTVPQIQEMFNYLQSSGTPMQQGASGLDYANLGLSGIQTLGNLWGSYQANKLAKDQFNFMKDTTNTNLRNQISAFNTALKDRASTRAQANSAAFTQDDASKYIQENQLTR